MAKGYKTGGRKKGSLNKVTRDTRELLQEILTGELENVHDTLKQAEPKDRLQFIIKLLPYTIPQYTSIEIIEKQPERSSWSKEVMAAIRKSQNERPAKY